MPNSMGILSYRRPLYTLEFYIFPPFLQQEAKSHVFNSSLVFAVHSWFIPGSQISTVFMGSSRLRKMREVQHVRLLRGTADD